MDRSKRAASAGRVRLTMSCESDDLASTVAALREEIIECRRVEIDLHDARVQLRALSGRLLTIVEDERRRISREIHDELGQVLSALTLDLAWLGRKLDVLAPPLADKVRKTSQLAETMLESVETIATNLRPAMLDDIGLSAAMEWMVRKFRERTQIPCWLSVEEDPIKLDSERSIAVFRLAQEALTNVSRHAEATEVEIFLSIDCTQIVLDVRDNGRGIHPEAIASTSSLGLVGMRERVGRFGGWLNIQGTPGRGTHLRFVIPFAITKEYSRK